MGCNSCKNNQNFNLNNNNKNESVIANGNSYIFKFFIFLIASCLLVLTFPILLVMLFKTIVLNNSINLMPLLLKIGNIFTTKENNIEDNDNEEINPEELELAGVDEIKIVIPKTKPEDRQQINP